MAKNFVILLIPGFSLIDLASVIEPLRSANRQGGDLYSWQLISLDGLAVRACSNIEITVDSGLTDLVAGEVLIVVAAYEPLMKYDSGLRQWLTKQSQAGATLGMIDTGAFIVAEAGLMKEHRVALHWEAAESYRERYPDHLVSDRIYAIDARRISAAGSTAALDLMLEIIHADHGPGLVRWLAEQFMITRVRGPEQAQKEHTAHPHAINSPKLMRAIEKMLANLEAPISLDEVAEQVGMTSRHLSRLFRERLGDNPSNFYMKIRLDKARQMLQQSDLSVTQIGVLCGFESPSYFTKCYKQRYGCIPKSDRSSLTGARKAREGK